MAQERFGTRINGSHSWARWSRALSSRTRPALPFSLLSHWFHTELNQQWERRLHFYGSLTSSQGPLLRCALRTRAAGPWGSTERPVLFCGLCQSCLARCRAVEIAHFALCCLLGGAGWGFAWKSIEVSVLNAPMGSQACPHPNPCQLSAVCNFRA